MARRIVLHSPLTPTALATKLRDTLGDKNDSPKAGVTGHGSEDDMMLFVYRPNIQNSFATNLTATMEAESSGTRIDGRIGAPRSAGCFMIFWFGFLSIFVTAAGLAAFSGAPVEFWAMFGGIPLAMMVFGGLLMGLGTRGSKPDEAAILKFLSDTVQARER